jgi:hypothetical protein
MSFSSPTSVITAIAVLGTCRAVSRCASRSSAQALSTGWLTFAMNGASWTKRNGKFPCPHASRQSRIIAGNSVWYCQARPAFDSPWYQIAPRMP